MKSNMPTMRRISTEPSDHDACRKDFLVRVATATNHARPDPIPRRRVGLDVVRLLARVERPQGECNFFI